MAVNPPELEKLSLCFTESAGCRLVQAARKKWERSLVARSFLRSARAFYGVAVVEYYVLRELGFGNCRVARLQRAGIVE